MVDMLTWCLYNKILKHINLFRNMCLDKNAFSRTTHTQCVCAGINIMARALAVYNISLTMSDHPFPLS